MCCRISLLSMAAEHCEEDRRIDLLSMESGEDEVEAVAALAAL